MTPPRIYQPDTVIQLYRGDFSDSQRLLTWYAELVQSGDLDKVLFPSTHSLGSFMRYFQPGPGGNLQLLYCTDDQDQIELAVWGAVMAQGIIFFSFWSRKSLRYTKRGVQMMLDIYRKLFNTFQVICGITKQERLLKVHQHIGYKIVSKVPKVWGGVEDGWLLTLTREDFIASCGEA